MTQAHTPTPWRLQNNGADFETCEIATVYCVEAIPTEEGIGQSFVYITANKPCFEVSEKEQTANAAFIVQACNAHDDLVTAVREALDTKINSLYEKGWDDDRIEKNPAVIKYRAALAKAKAVL